MMIKVCIVLANLAFVAQAQRAGGNCASSKQGHTNFNYVCPTGFSTVSPVPTTKACTTVAECNTNCCTVNTCTCSNGVAALGGTAAKCTTAGSETCTSCAAGFTLTNKKCVANKCTFAANTQYTATSCTGSITAAACQVKCAPGEPGTPTVTCLKQGGVFTLAGCGTTTTTFTPWDSSASSSKSASLESSYSSSFKASSSDVSHSNASSGSTGSGSWGSYLRTWQWFVLVPLLCLCCLSPLAFMGSKKPKQKRAPSPKPAEPEPVPEAITLEPLLPSLGVAMPVTTTTSVVPPYAVLPQSTIAVPSSYATYPATSYAAGTVV